MDFKEIVCDITDCEVPEKIRLREKSHNGFFGRIFRENHKTLKQLGMKDRSSIVLQILKEAEELTDPNTYVLLLSWRDPVEKLYKNTVEVKFTGRKFSDLQDYMLSHADETCKQNAKFVKHVPHEFTWKVMDGEMECKEKKKGKERKFLLKEI